MSRRNKKMLQDNVSFYCTIELINASADVVEIGRNVKLEDGEPHESHGNDNKMDKRHVCEDIDIYSSSEVNTAGSGNRVTIADDGSSPGALRDALDKKLEHLSSVARDMLIPVMTKYCDLFLYDHSGMLPCMIKCFHNIKTGDDVWMKKNPYKVPFVLKEEM